MEETSLFLHRTEVCASSPSGDLQHLSGFALISQARVEVWFRAPAGRVPDVLEVGVHGRRRPRVEAYWDGCRVAL